MIVSREFKGKETYGKWTLLSRIRGGGNGEVWICKNKDGDKRAIKLLKKTKESAFVRFKDEVKSIHDNQDIEGVIKIYEYYIADDYEKEVSFYIMPIGHDFMRHIKTLKFTERIDVFIQIVRCLKDLHFRGIVHRDIKPSNLIFIDNDPYLIDFGLVDFPNKTDLTPEKSAIGPRWTIAPEVKRESNEHVDFFKADTYSLTKTLWIILTERDLGFEGQYNIDTILEIKKKYKREYTTPIDNILQSGTDNDPTKRPSLVEILKILSDWKVVNDDFHLANNEQWAETLNKLFPVGAPARAIWASIDDIIRILNVLGSIKSLNHMFMPDRGGLDFKHASHSVEDDCIEINASLIYIVKPKRLIFESFGDEPNWNYFRLETGDLEPSGVYSSEQLDGRISEALSEMSPGVYDEYDLVEYRLDYRDAGREVPDSARHITRYFKGDFVIFNKRSYYNLDHRTYDARHYKMSTDEFRAYIKRQVETSAMKYES